MSEISYDVRVYKTKVYKGTKVTTYWVRWRVGGEDFQEPFRVAAQADSFRSELNAAARKGEAFSMVTGRPVSWKRVTSEMTWHDFACAYVDMKWKTAAAGYRKNIARALTAATTAMLTSDRGRPEAAMLRKALFRYAFNTKNRADAPEDIAAVLSWVSRNTALVSTLASPANARRILEAATTNTDGKRAAASTARRHRVILANALDYAHELGAIDTAVNPIRKVKWQAPLRLTAVDRRSVVNPRQARQLLDAVGAQEPNGPRLVAFFATIYYAGLRPEEVFSLTKSNVTLPPHSWNPAMQRWDDVPGFDGWGELEFGDAAPDVGRDWTDDGDLRDRRQLKHRAVGDTRTVPVHPKLAKLLRTHIETFGTSADGKLFTGVRGGELASVVCRRAWIAAREAALTKEQQASPLARRIYDLRHACLSGWLNVGVPPTQVAKWAGHSVDVLLRIYAKCIDGQDETAKRRIVEALGDDTAAPPPTESEADNDTAQDEEEDQS
jgi:integrase